MTLQAILTSLKKIRGRRQPPYINSSLAAHPQPRLTQPFCSAKKIPPACLENLYISNMSNSFVEACPGDVLSTKVVIADDKSSGSFRHENRPKLPALIEPWWDDPKYQALYNSFADEIGVRRLPFRDDTVTPSNVPISETTESIDSVIDIGMVTALEAVLLADGTCRDQPDGNPDTASSGTGSPASSSVSWVSFEGFRSPDVSTDVDSDISTTDTASMDTLDALDKASSVTGGASVEVASVPVVHPVAFDPAVLLHMGQEFSDVKIMQPQVSPAPDPITLHAITESDALALMGFGRPAAKKIEPELAVASPVVHEDSAAATTVPLVPLSVSESFRKYLRAEGKKMAMCAIKDEPLPEMPDTPPRFKKPVATIVATPLVALSSSASLRKYLRAEGKKIAMHALGDEPYPDMPETPPRFKKRFVKTIIPTSYAEEPVIVSGPEALKTDSQDKFRSVPSLAAEDIFGPDESPTRTCLLAADDDFVVIDPMLSKVFNLPRHDSNMRRAVSKVKRLSRRGYNATSPSPSSIKTSRTSISSFAPTRLLSLNKSLPWR